MARPYIIVIASEKGGVGKTTLATNLAIYLKALAEELPVTLLSFDNHFTIDRMFQLTKPGPDQHVGRIFMGTAIEKLVSLGQYGVHYIPSHENLPAARNHLNRVSSLAETMSRSDLEGLLIIDTSPALDIFTRNALYIADRIIVPIKDAPSLENCRHLSDFLTEHQRQKSLLKILPCLIDTRIHFEGPFRNSYQLLKAYAINRGYRCFEGYIAKSPKVESLATNPSGKIYPVMTHGRSTEVHLQLTHLARQVYLDYLEQGPSRLNEISNELFESERQASIDYRNRIKRLHPECLGCETPMGEEKAWPGAWYIEDRSGIRSGYIEDQCFMQMLISECYPEINIKQTPLLKELLVDSDPEACLLLHLDDCSGKEKRLHLYRLNAKGAILSRRTTIPKESSFLQRRGRKNLLQLFPLSGHDNNDQSQLVLARKTNEDPFRILTEIPYQELEQLFARACANIAARAS